jgi:hypothetical protein
MPLATPPMTRSSGLRYSLLRTLAGKDLVGRTIQRIIYRRKPKPQKIVISTKRMRTMAGSSFR